MEPLQSHLSEKTARRQLATNPIADEIVRWSNSQTPPYMDTSWLLGIRGEILDLIDQWKNHDMLIKVDLSVTVFNQGLHWLAVEWAPEQEEITHPLIPFVLLNIKDDSLMLNLWREKRSKVRILAALYNFLLGDDVQTIDSVSEKNSDDIIINIPQRWVNYLAMSRNPMYQSAILYTSKSLGVDIIKMYDANDEPGQQLSPAINEYPDSTLAPALAPRPTPIPANASGTSLTYEDFYGALIGGFTPKLLNKLLGSQHLGMYDFDSHHSTPAATSGAWVNLYWALKLCRFLPKKLSAGMAERLLRKTFKAKVSKSQITKGGRENVDLEYQEAHNNTEVARIGNLLMQIVAGK